eukprot:s284_g33.t1
MFERDGRSASATLAASLSAACGLRGARQTPRVRVAGRLLRSPPEESERPGGHQFSGQRDAMGSLDQERERERDSFLQL